MWRVRSAISTAYLSARPSPSAIPSSGPPLVSAGSSPCLSYCSRSKAAESPGCLSDGAASVMLGIVARGYGSAMLTHGDVRWPYRRRPGLITLNAVGWAALIALGSLVSVLGSLLLPLPLALALGLASSSAAYTAEWLMTRRDMNRRGRGRGPGGGPSGVREPRRPRPPLPTLTATRLTPE